MKYDFLVFLARMQPYHIGHHHVLQSALKISENVIIVLGSHEKSISHKNPFTTNERIDIIWSALTETEKTRVYFVSQHDHPYNENRWLISVTACVNAIALNKFKADPIKIGIIGYDKDHSSYYLKKFPYWNLVEVEPYKINDQIVNATDLRYDLYHWGNSISIRDYCVSDQHHDMIMNSIQPKLDKLKAEVLYLNKYEGQYGSGPFLTADAVVTCQNHILVIKRGSGYGENQYALPGGFVNSDERIKNACIRELIEETAIDVPVAELYESIRDNKFYDKPDRDARGRIVTHAYRIVLNNQMELPIVKGSDDAKCAFWMTLDEFKLSRYNWYADHYYIIEDMLGL